jgi:hypothetical protein
VKNDILAEEKRKPMSRFRASWDQKQFVRSRMGKKQKEEVEKVLTGEVKEYEK